MSHHLTRAHRRPTRARLLARALTPLLRHVTLTPAPVTAAAPTDGPAPCSMRLLDEGYIAQRPPTRVPQALRQGDRVRIVGLRAFVGHRGLEGIVVAIEPDAAKPVVLDVPGVGVIYCDAADLALLERPSAVTLVMDAVLDELPLMGGAR